MLRIIIPHGAILGTWNADAVDHAARTLVECLHHGEADVLELAGIPPASALLQAIARHQPRRGISVSVATHDHWKMNLPVPGEDPIKKLGKRSRTNTGRERRVFERDFAGEFAFQSFSDEDHVPQFVEWCEAIARKTYQRRLGFGFVAGAETLNRLSLEARRGRLRAYILFIRNEPAAYWICTLAGDTLYLDYTGYAPEYRKYDIGKISFIYVLERIRDEATARTADFGSGDGFLKRVFGDSVEQEVTVQFYSSALRNFVWALVVRGIVVLDRSAKSLLHRTGQLNKAKRLWRFRSRTVAPLTHGDGGMTPH